MSLPFAPYFSSSLRLFTSLIGSTRHRRLCQYYSPLQVFGWNLVQYLITFGSRRTNLCSAGCFGAGNLWRKLTVIRSPTSSIVLDDFTTFACAVLIVSTSLSAPFLLETCHSKRTILDPMARSASLHSRASATHETFKKPFISVPTTNCLNICCFGSCFDFFFVAR